MMTNSTCLWSGNHSVTSTRGGGACAEGKRGSHQNSCQTPTLRKMVMNYWMPGATLARRVRRSRTLLILSLCAVLAAFGRQKTDAPGQEHSPAVVGTGSAKASAGAADPAGRSLPRQSPVFWGAEAADAHSEENQQSYARGPRAVYGRRYTPHAEEEHPSVPSHLIMRAAVEEALSTLEDRSHGAAESKKKKHSPSTTQEAAKGLVSHENVTDEPAEGETHAGLFSGDSVSADDILELGSHDSHEQWPEEHVGIHDEVEQTDVPVGPVHWRHLVRGGHDAKTPAAETFDQYDALLTLIDGGGPRNKEVSLDSDVLGAAADPMIPPAEAELGMNAIVGLKHANSRGLALQPIAMMLTAVLLAVALMIAHSQSDTAKEFLQQTLLPGRRQEALGHVPHEMVNYRAGDRYLDAGYIADLGEHSAAPQILWMRGDDETAAAPYDNDLKIRNIEQRIILVDPEKDEGSKSSNIGTSQARAYRAEQSVGAETMREPFDVPAGTAGETAYKDKKDYHDSADSSAQEALESVESEDAEVGAHHD